MTVRPFASMTRVAGPRCLRIAASLPTARMRSPLTATALTMDDFSSTVRILPLCTMRSASSGPSPAGVISTLASTRTMADRARTCRSFMAEDSVMGSLPLDRKSHDFRYMASVVAEVVRLPMARRRCTYGELASRPAQRMLQAQPLAVRLGAGNALVDEVHAIDAIA